MRRPSPGSLGFGLVLAAAAAAAGAPLRAAPQALSPTRDIGFDQKLGEQAPLELPFRDESGKPVRLGDYFGKGPVILVLAYSDCPMLCPMAMRGIVSSLKTLTFDAGREFEFVSVSFDPRETPKVAATRKAAMVAEYGRPGTSGGWHFLTGGDESIRRLTAALGFRYAWDEEQKQYAHATGLVVVTSEGRIARYFFGVEYAPKDLRLGLIEAAGGRIGTLADQLLLLCYHYDPQSGRYSALTLGSIRAGGLVTVLGLGAFILIMTRRDRRRAQRAETEP